MNFKINPKLYFQIFMLSVIFKYTTIIAGLYFIVNLWFKHAEELEKITMNILIIANGETISLIDIYTLIVNMLFCTVTILFILRITYVAIKNLYKRQISIFYEVIVYYFKLIKNTVIIILALYIPILLSLPTIDITEISSNIILGYILIFIGILVNRFAKSIILNDLVKKIKDPDDVILVDLQNDFIEITQVQTLSIIVNKYFIDNKYKLHNYTSLVYFKFKNKPIKSTHRIHTTDLKQQF